MSLKSFNVLHDLIAQKRREVERLEGELKLLNQVLRALEKDEAEFERVTRELSYHENAVTPPTPTPNSNPNPNPNPPAVPAESVKPAPPEKAPAAAPSTTPAKKPRLAKAILLAALTAPISRTNLKLRLSAYDPQAIDAMLSRLEKEKALTVNRASLPYTFAAAPAPENRPS